MRRSTLPCSVAAPVRCSGACLPCTLVGDSLAFVSKRYRDPGARVKAIGPRRPAILLPLSEERPTRPDFRFGRFVLRPGERHLLADGVVVPLESRAFDVLRMLVENAGRLVTKEELLDAVWPARVVEEGNLHVQISALRKAVGGGVIATVPGHGYRFSAHVDAIAAPSPSSGVRPNLPRQLASFVGREDDLARLAQLLPQTRLLTLTGMGGCGKTRLAIALAERVAAGYPDGVHFVDLAPVAEPARVAPVVAATLSIRENAEIAITDTLARDLAPRRMLVVLDNCESLLDACAALVGTLLAATTALCIVVTSRERLGIAGERVVPVLPLALPPAEADHDPHAAGAFAAVRLFVERAAHVASEFRLDAGNVAAVVEICRRLDGIPLALELAAARVALLSVEQIRTRLDDRFRLLTGSPRAVTRHQTLLATLQSSCDALSDDERRCLECLSVFAGGWTLATATAVAADGDDIDTLQRLGRLVDKSFVQVDRDGAQEPRYGMLETVRSYAFEQLVARGAERETRERHLACFLDFSRTAQGQLVGATMREWLQRIDAELPNLLAAHAWCDHARDGTDRGLELAANLRMYWLARGYFAVGHRVHEEALARPGSDPRGMLRGKALHAFGQHHYVRGRLADSIAPTREALVDRAGTRRRRVGRLLPRPAVPRIGLAGRHGARPGICRRGDGGRAPNRQGASRQLRADGARPACTGPKATSRRPRARMRKRCGCWRRARTRTTATTRSSTWRAFRSRRAS